MTTIIDKNFEVAAWYKTLENGVEKSLDMSTDKVLGVYRQYQPPPPKVYKWTFNLLRSWHVISKKNLRIVRNNAGGPNGPNWFYADDVLGPNQEPRFRKRWPKTTDMASQLLSKDIEAIFKANLGRF